MRLVPETFSENVRATPAVRSASICASRLCPSVDSLA